MDIKVEVTYKNIKNMHLRVRDGIVKISAPFKVKEEFIKKFVNDNLDYIKNQLKLQEEKQNAKNIKINDFITLFDKKYQILPISTKAKVTENFIFVNENKDIRNQIKNLFKNVFLKYIITLTYMDCCFSNRHGISHFKPQKKPFREKRQDYHNITSNHLHSRLILIFFRICGYTYKWSILSISHQHILSHSK